MQPIPAQLIAIMQKHMPESIHTLLEVNKNDVKIVKELFKNSVLSAPYDAKLAEKLHPAPKSLKGLNVQFIHRLYNDPDHTKLSEINASESHLSKFREEMKATFKLIMR